MASVGLRPIQMSQWVAVNCKPYFLTFFVCFFHLSQISSASSSYDRNQADLDAIRRDPATYCNEPAVTAEEWDQFCRSFNLSGKTEEISRLLTSHAEMRALHGKLVPAVVAHDVFWQRYFLRVRQIELENSRRKRILEDVSLQGEEDITWDDDEDVGDVGGEEEAQTTEKVPVLQAPVTPAKEARPDAEKDLGESNEVPKPAGRGEEPPSPVTQPQKTESVPTPAPVAAVSAQSFTSSSSSSSTTSSSSSPPKDSKMMKNLQLPGLGHGRGQSDDFEVISGATTTSSATTPPVEIMEDEAFEKAINDISLDDKDLVGNEDEGWGSDWE